jgi:hypothetical protein
MGKKERGEMIRKISAITIDAMPVATAVKGKWGIFGCWTNIESPTRPVKTIVGAIVQGR